MNPEPDNLDCNKKTIVITPLAEFGSLLIECIAEKVGEIFNCDTEIITLLHDIDFAFDPNRNQYHSTAILTKLESLSPAHAVKILAITNVDLFIPILTHVYGEAQLGGKAAVISTCRLQENLSTSIHYQTIDQRIVKEAVHELAHTFGLKHCPDEDCIMHYCRSTKDVDRKTDQLCRYCHVLLEDEIEKIL